MKRHFWVVLVLGYLITFGLQADDFTSNQGRPQPRWIMDIQSNVVHSLREMGFADDSFVSVPEFINPAITEKIHPAFLSQMLIPVDVPLEDILDYKNKTAYEFWVSVPEVYAQEFEESQLTEPYQRLEKRYKAAKPGDAFWSYRIRAKHLYAWWLISSPLVIWASDQLPTSRNLKRALERQESRRFIFQTSLPVEAIVSNVYDVEGAVGFDQAALVGGKTLLVAPYRTLIETLRPFVQSYDAKSRSYIWFYTRPVWDLSRSTRSATQDKFDTVEIFKRLTQVDGVIDVKPYVPDSLNNSKFEVFIHPLLVIPNYSGTRWNVPSLGVAWEGEFGCSPWIRFLGQNQIRLKIDMP